MYLEVKDVKKSYGSDAGYTQVLKGVPANTKTAYSQGYTDIYSVKIFTTPPIRNFMQTKAQQHRVSTTIPQTVSVTSM